MNYLIIIMATAAVTLLADQALSMIAQRLIKRRRAGRAWNGVPFLEVAQ